LERNGKSAVSAFALVAYTGAESSQSVLDAAIRRCFMQEGANEKAGAKGKVPIHTMSKVKEVLQ
jgi:hypothetical protein